MNIELLDIVDSNDTVIGTTDRKTAHSHGQLHRVAAVYVFNQMGELYVQEHTRDGKWDHSVGGHVSKGETYALAASRETKEELGITQSLVELATSLRGDEHPNQKHLFGLYSCIADPSWKFVPNDEVKIIFPMSIASIRRAMIDEPKSRFTPGFRITMAEYVRLNDL